MKQLLKQRKVYMWIGIIILIGIFSITYVSFRIDMNNAIGKQKAIPSKVFASKFGDIEYLVKGDGPTILISHGITGGIDQGMGLADTYVGQNYRFLYISRFGYLKSSMSENTSAKMQAEAYSELLDYLKIKKVFIVGNSAGGSSAMNFAADYPEKCEGLILISSVMPISAVGNKVSAPPDVVFKSDFVYWLATKLAGKSLMKMFIPPTILNKMTKPEIEKIKNNVFTAVLPVSKRSEGIIFDNKISNPSIESTPFEFEQIKSPTLIIHAVDDPAPPYEGAKKVSGRIPGAELISIQDGGHLLLGHEEEVKKEISKFIIKIEGN